MRGKLINCTLRTIALMISTLILVVLFAVYINDGAVSGRTFDMSMHVESGNPSVLADVSFSIWTIRRMGGYNWRNNLGYNIMHDIISFDQSGAPSITCSAQMYEQDVVDTAFESDFFMLHDFRSDIFLDEPSWPLQRDGMFLAVSLGYIGGIDDNQLLFLQVTNENELVFSGYIAFLDRSLWRMEITNEMLYSVLDSNVNKRYVYAYKLPQDFSP